MGRGGGAGRVPVDRAEKLEQGLGGVEGFASRGVVREAHEAAPLETLNKVGECLGEEGDCSERERNIAFGDVMHLRESPQ